MKKESNQTFILKYVIFNNHLHCNTVYFKCLSSCLPFKCFKSYCSVRNLFFMIKASKDEKSATVPEYNSPSENRNPINHWQWHLYGIKNKWVQFGILTSWRVNGGIYKNGNILRVHMQHNQFNDDDQLWIDLFNHHHLWINV